MTASSGIATRVGVIGDPHSEHTRLAGVLDWFAGQRVDCLVCTGDIADGRGSIDRCCAMLAEAGVLTVAGNHDRWLLENRVRHVANAHHREEIGDDAVAYLSSLPRSRRVETSGGALMLCHGVAEKDLARVWPGRTPAEIKRSRTLDGLIGAGDYRYLVNGHMHFRMLLDFETLTLLNAGTLMGDHAGVSIMDFSSGSISAYALDDSGRPELIVEMPLSADGTRPVWRDTRAFRGDLLPVTLHRHS